MKIRILRGARFRPWFILCWRWGHQWEATSEQTDRHVLYRCGACSKEKWGERWSLEFFS